jgi:hypothetical protein
VSGTRGKKRTLDELLASIPPGHMRRIDPAELSKEEYFEMRTGRNVPQHILNLSNSPASNRELIMELVGLLEEALTRKLSSVVRPTSSKVLFGKGGKCRDLETKVELAFGLCLLTQQQRANLNALRSVRNQFAHDPRLLHFEHSDRVMQDLRLISTAFDDFTPPVRVRLCFATYALHRALRVAGADEYGVS